MIDSDLFNVITEKNSNRLAYRKEITDGHVTCPAHGQMTFIRFNAINMKVVGFRNDVYGLQCPMCHTRAFAVRKKVEK